MKRLISLLALPGLLLAENAPEGMVHIKGATYLRGTAKGGPGFPPITEEQPAHKVTVSDFYIDAHEVTNAQFKKLSELVRATFSSMKHNRKESAVNWKRKQQCNDLFVVVVQSVLVYTVKDATTSRNVS